MPAYGGAEQCFKLGRQDSDHGHFALAALTTCENNPKVKFTGLTQNSQVDPAV